MSVLAFVGKVAIFATTGSFSILANLVDASLHLLTTAFVWETTRLVTRQDQYSYPTGRRRLEPVGFLLLSVVSITAFLLVALECIMHFITGREIVVHPGLSAVLGMAGLVLLKAVGWLWCLSIRNYSIRTLTQAESNGIFFDLFSIVFPIGKRS